MPPPTALSNAECVLSSGALLYDFAERRVKHFAISTQANFYTRLRPPRLGRVSRLVGLASTAGRHRRDKIVIALNS
jgi:hypothetical protein